MENKYTIRREIKNLLDKKMNQPPSKEMTFRQGDFLILRLKENPSTGFRWQLSTSPGLKIIDDTFEQQNPNILLPGQGGFRVWKIHVIDLGNQFITGIYKQAWLNSNGSQTYHANLKIIPK